MARRPARRRGRSVARCAGSDRRPARAEAGRHGRIERWAAISWGEAGGGERAPPSGARSRGARRRTGPAPAPVGLRSLVGLRPRARVRAHAGDAARPIGRRLGVVVRSTVMPAAHRPSRLGTGWPEAGTATPDRRRSNGGHAVLDRSGRDASGATRRPMIPQAARRRAATAATVAATHRQPSTTYSSRGASLSAIGPSGPHTTMSSIRAPYSPTR